MEPEPATAPGTADLLLRPGSRDDLSTVADLHTRVRDAAVPAMPPRSLSEESVHAYVQGWDLDVDDLWVAETDRLVGYALLQRDWLHSLYVDPACQRSGVGASLLELAKQLRPDGFSLWVFESNRPARAFYAHHGLVELERTDGHGNDEQAPDLQMTWPGRDPLTALRRMLDDVDDRLAALLQHRAALTAAAQGHKPVAGHAGRELSREWEIAARMAETPGPLESDAFALIVDAVITASLNAVPKEEP